MLQNAAGLLQEYKHERDILLDMILFRLQDDPRISAAWLAGSLGRGEGDALSDLDLWVAVKQEHIAEVVKARREFAAQGSNVILFVDTPQNAPAGGGYLAACYEGTTAPHLVDWYWLPDSMTLPTVPMKLLFDRSGSEDQAGPVPFIPQAPAHEPPESPAHSISFFWMMLLITAKHVARLSPKINELLDITLASFRQAADFINANGSKDDFFVPDYDASSGPGEKLLFLHRLAIQMQKMMAITSAIGFRTSEKIVPGAFRYLEMVNKFLQQTLE